MAEERKDSFAETVDTAASAAHTVKGAIKAGKAISGAAKGAAAGGPYGAVAGAVWAGRKHIGKIIAVIIILLLLPVLFILMLPGLIFGGLINAFSPADTEQPVLNSETAIVFLLMMGRPMPSVSLFLKRLRNWNRPSPSGPPAGKRPRRPKIRHRRKKFPQKQSPLNRCLPLWKMCRLMVLRRLRRKILPLWPNRRQRRLPRPLPHPDAPPLPAAASPPF